MYNPTGRAGGDIYDHKRMYFDLDTSTPVKVLNNKHLEQDDSWFDMHYEVEVGIVLNGRMNRKYLNFEKDLHRMNF